MQEILFWMFVESRCWKWPIWGLWGSLGNLLNQNVTCASETSLLFFSKPNTTIFLVDADNYGIIQFTLFFQFSLSESSSFFLIYTLSESRELLLNIKAHMQQGKKDAIRANIKSLRMAIKGKCTEKNEDGRDVWKSNTENQEAPVIRRRRKTSENLKSFESLSVFRDKSVASTFEDYYQLQNRLGEGTQSIVYQCRQIGTDEIFAVKVAKQKDPEVMHNLRNCYQLLQELDHESIIKGKYLYMNEKKLTCHMITEMINYPELRSFMNEKKTKNEKIQETRIASIIKTLLECLVYLSDKGVCHRDIKPQNILYDPVTEKLKLIDFEIARMQRYAHQRLELWSCTGTPYYRAPQSYSKSYGIPVDTWAVGMICFEMLTGSLPFKTQYIASTIKKICNKEINFDEYGLSSSAKSFVKRLLDKSPQTRITPKQALSHSFILKNTTQSPKNFGKLTKRKSLSQEQNLSDDTEHTPTKYYQEDMHFSRLQSISKDIGVRFCEQ